MFTCLIFPCVRAISLSKVNFSGAVSGKAVWPSGLKPVAWHDGADTMMFKLGLYHIKNKVGATMVGRGIRTIARIQ